MYASFLSKWCLRNKLSKSTSLLCNFSLFTRGLTTQRHSYTVSPYCNIEVNCPFNVRIQPLNVFEENAQDKVIINLLSNKKSPLPIVHCTQNDNDIKILSSNTAEEEGCLCTIDAPIKASMHVKVHFCILCINKY